MRAINELYDEARKLRDAADRLELLARRLRSDDDLLRASARAEMDRLSRRCAKPLRPRTDDTTESKGDGER